MHELSSLDSDSGLQDLDGSSQHQVFNLTEQSPGVPPGGQQSPIASLPPFATELGEPLPAQPLEVNAESVLPTPIDSLTTARANVQAEVLPTEALVGASDFSFANFSDSAGLTINGDAAEAQGKLRLTDAQNEQSGSAFYSEAVAFDDNTSFETHFKFRLLRGDGVAGAAGLAFVVQNTDAGAEALGSGGSGIGYAGTGTGSIAIEFDTFARRGSGDINSNHVGVLTNGRVSEHLELATPDFDLNGGDIINAWVQYNGRNNRLRIFVNDRERRPGRALISTQIDIAEILGGQAFLGFSAGTGGRANIHDLRQWSFSSTGAAETSDLNTIALQTNTLNVAESGQQVLVPIVRDGVTTESASIEYSTGDITAIAGEDYEPTSGTATFAPGETLLNIPVTILNDDLNEANEQFSFAIGNGTNAQVGLPRTTQITIEDNDQSTTESGIEFVQAVSTVQENIGEVSITVQRTGDLSQAASVQYETFEDEARGQDFSAAAGTLNFGPGEAQQTFSITIQNDTLPEIGEDIGLQLSNPQNAELGPQTIARIRIEDDDEHPFTVRSETVVESLGGGRRSGISSFDWTPDNETLFIAQSNGIVRLQENGELLDESFLDISDQITRVPARGQGGIQGIAVHPNFPEQPFVYIAFAAATYSPPDGTQETEPHSYVVRVRASAATDFKTAIPGSTRILLQIPTSPSLFHSTGGLRFGDDGSLFYSHGDSQLAVVVGQNLGTLDLDSPQGKIFRLNPLNGQGLADNPFATDDLRENRSKVYSLGTRNPFRFALHPDTGEPFIGDVGASSWEEINTGRGANFGWPLFEGGNGTSLRQPGNANNPRFRDFYAQFEDEVEAPIYAREHQDDAAAIIVGDFYSGDVYPEIFDGALFFGDFAFGDINALLFDEDGNVESVTPFTQETDVTFTAQGPDGLLYYANLQEGTIKRWIVEENDGGVG